VNEKKLVPSQLHSGLRSKLHIWLLTGKSSQAARI
jgi:hypothetical protein